MADIATGKGAGPDAARGTQASILDALPDDDDHILVTHNKRDKRLFDVYRINIKTGAETLVAQNPATSRPGTPITRAKCAPPGLRTASTRHCSTARPKRNRSSRC